MRIVKLALRRETAIPVLAVVFSSAVSAGLVFARVIWTGRVEYACLVWNLFLAWLPLVFALLACENYRNTSWRSWRFLGLTAAWVLFFPNSPYIFTDVIHVALRHYPQFWVDLVLVLLCALTGLVVGFLSLYLMQTVVVKRFGRPAGWLFVAIMAGLAGFGVYVGRVLRFNSWDVVWKPAQVYHGIGRWVADPFGEPTAFAFPAMFATFLFVSYLMLYALTHLQPARAETQVEGPG